MNNQSSPIGRFAPSKQEVREVQVAYELGVYDARKMLIRQNLQQALEEAKTLEELKPIISALISCAHI